jgi:hypothetical protein
MCLIMGKITPSQIAQAAKSYARSVLGSQFNVDIKTANTVQNDFKKGANWLLKIQKKEKKESS